jgi:AcrR family transcriptional regulator
MARRPSRPRKAKRAAERPERRAAPPPPPPTGSDRQRIIGAFMQLLAEKPIERIDVKEIAARANVSLARLREEFDTRLSILAAQMKEIDRAVLEGAEGEVAEEPPRDRLFDVLMRRLEALAPYKEAVRSLMRSAACNPGLALALNGLAIRSMRWMLTAAGISTSGSKGAIRAQGLAFIFARVLRVWVNDDDPGLARTMAELDRALTRGQSWSRLLDDLCAVIPRPRPRRRRRPRPDEDDEAAAYA